MNNSGYSAKLNAFEIDTRNQKSRLTSTSSGTSLKSITTFRGRSNTAPTSTKKQVRNIQKKLNFRHGAAELSPNIVRFHEEYVTAISTLQKKIKRGNVISE